MSDTAILTLRTMLANLDDAKKYQSLRDVMSTLPAPDLAAVFEDLPPEKLPVLVPPVSQGPGGGNFRRAYPRDPAGPYRRPDR